LTSRPSDSSLTTCLTLLIGKLITSIVLPNGHEEHQKHSMLIRYLQRLPHLVQAIGTTTSSHWSSITLIFCRRLYNADGIPTTYCIIFYYQGVTIFPCHQQGSSSIKAGPKYWGPAFCYRFKLEVEWYPEVTKQWLFAT